MKVAVRIKHSVVKKKLRFIRQGRGTPPSSHHLRLMKKTLYSCNMVICTIALIDNKMMKQIDKVYLIQRIYFFYQAKEYIIFILPYGF